MASRYPTLNFITEGRLALQEIGFAVKDGNVSSTLPCTESVVYLNITTREEEQFCVHLNMSGYQVVGRKYDTIEDHHNKGEVYETVFALLVNISTSYCTQFSSQLADKLLQLQSKEKELS